MAREEKQVQTSLHIITHQDPRESFPKTHLKVNLGEVNVKLPVALTQRYHFALPSSSAQCWIVEQAR